MDKIERFLSCDFVLLTRGRVDHQHLLSNMPEEILSMITIVCHPGEKELHSKTWGGKVKRITEYSGDFVGEAREWCINNLDGEYVFFFEDNLQFHVRKDPDFGEGNKYGLTNVNSSKFKEETLTSIYYAILLDIFDKLDTGEYGMVGVSHRAGNNRQPLDFVDNSRLYGFWALHKENYRKMPSRFSDVRYREDFYMELEFLLEGYKVGVFYKYAIDKKAVNQKGGCSSYRKPEETNQNAFEMEKMFPGFVRAVKKEKKSWNGYDEVWDVNISWKKAYEYGRQKRDI